AVRIGLVAAAGLGGDGVVLHREGEVGPPHWTVLLLERLEGVRGVQLMQHMAVDVDQLAAVDALGDQMGIPDFFEQGFGHDFFRRSCGWRLSWGLQRSIASRRSNRMHDAAICDARAAGSPLPAGSGEGVTNLSRDPNPLTPPLSPSEREQTESAARL